MKDRIAIIPLALASLGAVALSSSCVSEPYQVHSDPVPVVRQVAYAAPPPQPSNSQAAPPSQSAPAPGAVEGNAMVTTVQSPAGGGTRRSAISAPGTVESNATVTTESAVALPELPPELEELVKLSQAQVGDEVLIAYIERENLTVAPTADELIYLRDIGFSDAVLAHLAGGAGTAPSESREASAPETPAAANTPAATRSAPASEPEPPLTESPYRDAPPVAAPAGEGSAPPQVVQAPPPETVIVDPGVIQTAPAYVQEYHPILAPYGTWFVLDGYGPCWQPSVTVVQGGWTPYSHAGRWLHSDRGWYWHSDYSWGWLPFHYGRWHLHHHHGWVWVPGDVWAPAWVSWRVSDTYGGWAPLPPGAHYRHGHGFTWHGSHVGVHFEFGLSHHHYTFLPLRHFHHHYRHRRHHHLNAHQAQLIYQKTVIVNHHNTQTGGTVNNEGIPRDTVEQAARQEIVKVGFRDISDQNRTVIRPGRMGTENGRPVVYRPTKAVLSANAATAREQQKRQMVPTHRVAPLTKAAGSRRAVSGGQSRALVQSSSRRSDSPEKTSAPVIRPRKAPTHPSAPNPVQADRDVTLKAPDPVRSVPKNPRIDVSPLKAPNPVTSTPKVLSPSRSVLSPPKPVTSVPEPVRSVPEYPRSGIKPLSPPSPVTSGKASRSQSSTPRSVVPKKQPLPESQARQPEPKRKKYFSWEMKSQPATSQPSTPQRPSYRYNPSSPSVVPQRRSIPSQVNRPSTPTYQRSQPSRQTPRYSTPSLRERSRVTPSYRADSPSPVPQYRNRSNTPDYRSAPSRPSVTPSRRPQSVSPHNSTPRRSYRSKPSPPSPSRSIRSAPSPSPKAPALRTPQGRPAPSRDQQFKSRNSPTPRARPTRNR